MTIDYSKGKPELRFPAEGLNIMVATPSHDGNFCYQYVSSLYHTMEVLSQHGIAHSWVTELYCADIVAARASLFTDFIESNATHLLWIDADMGWKPQDVFRLLAAEKDFVAVAGVRKLQEVSFALNPLKVNGDQAEVRFDQTTGTTEVADVGLAFALLSRDCVLKVHLAYPELTYQLPQRIQHSLCFPMFIGNQMYRAEDYAFCTRWRQLGGQVFVCPDISLEHVGKHVWKGAWTDTWEKGAVK